MINVIRYAYYGLFSIVCLMSTAIITFIPVFIFSLIKLLVPIKGIRYFCTSAVQYFVSVWVSVVIFIARFLSPTEIDVDQNKELDKNGSYLIICNHKSWLDTFILMMIFHKKIAFPKFFMKFQVFFIPVLGLIAWALEFPAMRRYKKEYLKQHPEKKGEDIKKTVEYCKKLSSRPTTIVNFVEGTRYTSQKAVKSNYKNLLNPKAGGIAVILKSLSDRMVGVLNTTIVYDNPKQTLWDYMTRRTKQIKVKVDLIPISEVPMGDYFSSEADKEHFQTWLNQLWQTNDEYISKEAKKITC